MANEEKLIGVSSLSPIIKKIKELSKLRITKVSELENDKSYISTTYSSTEPDTDYWEQPY